MSDASDLALPYVPSGPPVARTAHVPDRKTGKRLQITPKVKAAVDAMVWQGVPYQDAARAANLTVNRMRSALEKQHVKRYLDEQKQVFRKAASAANIHAAIDVRDQKVNQTARIQAVRYLDNLADADAQREAGRSVTPGVVVQVNVQRAGGQVDETVISVGPAASQAADDEPGNG